MSEYGYVEQPILNWLCGEPGGTYPIGGLGWIYRDETAMAQFERPLEDPIVEKLLGGRHPQNQFRGGRLRSRQSWQWRRFARRCRSRTASPRIG